MDLPEELRFSNMSKPHDAILYSNKIQPVSFSQQQVRFEVSKQGMELLPAQYRLPGSNCQGSIIYPIWPSYFRQ